MGDSICVFLLGFARTLYDQRIYSTTPYQPQLQLGFWPIVTNDLSKALSHPRSNSPYIWNEWTDLASQMLAISTTPIFLNRINLS